MATIRALYDGVVLHPLDRVELPDGATIEFEPRIVVPTGPTTPDPEATAWLENVSRSWTEDWADPREDIYTLDDGEPINGPR